MNKLDELNAELWDACVDTLFARCYHCIITETGNAPKFRSADCVKTGCPKKKQAKDCLYHHYWTIAKKVKTLKEKENERNKSMKASKENVKELIEEKGKAGITMIGFSDENTNTETEECSDDYNEEYCSFYHTNYNYPIEVTGEKLKEMSQDVCDYIFKLVYNGKKDIGLEGVNTARALSVCVAEAMNSLVEDMAEDLAEPEDWDCGDTPLSYNIGTVLEFPMDEENRSTKKAVVVDIEEKDGEKLYSVFLGHTTLTLPAPILLDMLRLVPYKKNK